MRATKRGSAATAVEEEVRGGGDYRRWLGFADGGVCIGVSGVGRSGKGMGGLTVAIIPLPVDPVPYIRCIMATTETTVVIIDCAKVIHHSTLLRLIGCTNPAAEIEALNGAFHEGIDLVPEAPAAGEALKMNYQHIGTFPELKFLGRSTMLFAFRTIPRIIGGENFLLRKFIKAVFEMNSLCATISAAATGTFKFRVNVGRELHVFVVKGDGATEVISVGGTGEEGIIAGIFPVDNEGFAELD